MRLMFPLDREGKLKYLSSCGIWIPWRILAGCTGRADFKLFITDQCDFEFLPVFQQAFRVYVLGGNARPKLIMFVWFGLFFL